MKVLKKFPIIVTEHYENFIESKHMLTTQQKKVQDFIRAFIQRHGHSPSLREIGEGVDIQSRGAVHRHVQTLIDRGVLKRPRSGWRTLELVETEDASTSLPLLGKIAAGRPIEAIPGHDEINLAEMLLGEERYVLQVEGDSMIDAGILDADLVVIQRTDTADDGEIVVALIDDEEATLKRLFHLSGRRIKLVAENRSLSPLIYPADRVRIQGVLTGQLRTYR
uniref:LexA repressor n=1 Tax=uncultured bacterium ws633F6 TaxID=1131832 RepID=I1X4Z0_9BACT|nr:transcriptional repressor, LexA family [uncultured bacterium ws633F6]